MDPNVQSVIDQHRKRAEAGMRKYGVATTRTDLSIGQWLQHLQDELMDAAVYNERLKSDMQNIHLLVRDIRDIASLPYRESPENEGRIRPAIAEKCDLILAIMRGFPKQIDARMAKAGDAVEVSHTPGVPIRIDRISPPILERIAALESKVAAMEVKTK